MKRGTRNLALLTPLALATAAFGQVYSSSPAVAITDATTVSDSIVVAGGPASITDLNVVVNLTHTFDGDLDMVLVAPGGTSYVQLSTDNGGAGDNYFYTRFDDAGATSITAGVAPYRGSFMPEGGAVVGWAGTIALPATALANLGALNGTDSNGTWTLLIDDDAGGDTGSLASWHLEFNGSSVAIPLAVTAATFAPAGNRINGDTLTLTATVSPAEGPASTGLGVTVDLSALGGSASQAFLDNGVAPDVAAGDNIFSYSHTITGAALGAVNLVANASDAEARTAAGNFAAMTIVAGGQGAPTATVDLGSIANPSTSSGTLTGFTAGQVQWIRMDIPAISAGGATYLDIDTNGAGAGNTFTNSTIALYDSTGARMGAQDTDDGPSLFSRLTYGDTSPARPAVPFVAPATAIGLTHNGVDGANLAAGVYWLAVGGTGITFDTANFRYTGTSTQVGDCAYTVVVGTDNATTSPTGVASYTPGAFVQTGNSLHFKVVVTNGLFPTSTYANVGSGVSVDGTLIGGGTIALFDDGAHNDGAAGDSEWGADVVVTAAAGAYTLPFNILDDQARTGTGNMPSLTVVGLPPTCPPGSGGASFTNVNSAAAVGTPANTTIPGASLNWTNTDPLLNIHVSGRLAEVNVGTFSGEANFRVNFADASFVIIDPFGTGGGFTGVVDLADFSMAIPAGQSPSTVTSIEAFETFDDGGDLATDATWTNLCFTYETTVFTPPSGVGTGGAVGACGGPVLTTVAVTPGAVPTSTGLAVNLDTASIGGGIVAMFDDGTNGDVTGGDNIFSLNVAVPGGPDATLAFPFAISDAQGRNAAGNLNISRGSDIGDLPGSAKKYYGTFPVSNTITDTINGGTDVDMFAICITDTVNFEAGVNNGGAAFDTQLFLFNANGTGAAMNDDEPDVAGTLQSHLMINNSLLVGETPIVLPSGGLYYLALAPYNRDPITSGVATDTIWANQSPSAAFDPTWAPNGVTPAAPVAGWTNTGNAGGAFTITLVGGATVCPADIANSGGAGPDCAVDINDLLYFLSAFEAGTIDVADSSGTGTQDCATDINDLLFFLARFEAGC